MLKSTATDPVLLLRLYVSGDAPNSLSAIANARLICETHFPAAYKIEIVDMLLHPLRAMADGIVVTPTLLRLTPLPAKRAVGNLSNSSQVLQLLAS